MNLNVRQLKALVSIAKLGSFTRAADLLHVSQPALTVQIHQLENALGGRLLDRNTRSVKLTQLGKEVVPVLEGVLRNIDAVMAHTHKLASKTTGVVSIAALPSVCKTILPEIISKFRQQYPGISIRLRDAVAPRIVAHVKAEEVDFGIGSIDNIDPEIRVTPLIADRMCVVFPSGHALEQKKVIALKDLAGFPLIEMEADRSVRSLVDRAFESIGHVAVPDYEASFIGTAIGMVKAGLGIAILSSLAVEAAALTGLHARTIKSPGLIRNITIMQKSGRSLSTAADSFLDAMNAAAKTLSSAGAFAGRRNRPTGRAARTQSRKADS